MSTLEKIENAVVEGYKKIEDGVVGGYKKIEETVVDLPLPFSPIKPYMAPTGTVMLRLSTAYIP